VLIIIGLATGLSIADLFIAALIPGLVLAAGLAAVVYVMCLLKPGAGPPGPETTMREKIASLPGSIEMVILFVMVMAGLYFGWFTPTEAGAAGAFFSMVIALAGGNLTWKRLFDALDDSVRTSSMIMMIVAGAVIFGKFMTVTRLPYQAADWAASLPVPAWAVLMVMLAIYVVGGAIMDALGLLMITIPIFFPVAQRLGYDPLWFAVLITIITTMGAITPPVGINTYIVAGMSDEIPLTTVFKGVTWFLSAFALTVLLMFLFPAMASRLH
jgi:tripartite ATP-independent transporter DctM subunit